MQNNSNLNKTIQYNGNKFMQEHYLYNLNIFINQEVIDKFHGVKYVCMQGSGDRAKALAQKLAKVTLGIEETYFTPQNLFKTAKFEVFRVGNILSVSHGMGTISIMNLLDDITKLMKASGNTDLEYIRIGTSGGINIAPGSVVVTDTAYKPDLTTGYPMTILGKEIIFPTQMDASLNERIIKAQPEIEQFNLYRGNSITADDFYLGQCRFDGAIKPRYDENMRQKYFKKIMALNIYNFEMESTAIASFCSRANISASMIAVTLIDRLNGDQVTATAEELDNFADRAHTVAINYLLSQIA